MPEAPKPQRTQSQTQQYTHTHTAMACSSMITLSRPTLSPSPSSSSSTAPSFLPPNPLCHVTTLRRFRTFRSKSLSSSKKQLSAVSASASLQALVFDCDGVILESEHLHRQAYNDAFAHFNVRCASSESKSQQPLNWGSDFYDQLQNRIGGGKPKMRWFSLLFSYLFLLFFFLSVDWLGFAIVSEGTLGSTVGRFQRYSRSLPRPMRTESS